MNHAETTRSPNSEGKTRAPVWEVYFVWMEKAVCSETAAGLFSNYDPILCSLDFMELCQQRIEPRLLII